jgi:branched-chain amino acid transport system substrate-binding protein
MRRRLAFIALLTLGLLFAGILAACGSSSPSGSASSAAAGKPILVGAPLPLTGPYAADAQSMQQGLEMAVADINAKGGVLGRPLKLDVYDVEDMAAEKLQAAADKLNLGDRVSVVITGYSTPGADVTTFGKYPQPFIQFDASSQNQGLIQKNPTLYGHVFTLGDIEAPYGKQTFDLISSQNWTYPNHKIAILAGNFAWDLKFCQGIKAEALAKGWQVALYEVFPYGTTEWGPILTKIRAANPSIIAISDLTPADEKTFLDQFATQPTQSLIDAGYAMSIQGFPQLVGANGTGVFGDATNSILPNAAGNDFKTRFAAKFGHPPGLSIVGTVYDGLMLWAKAAAKAGNPDNYNAVAQAMHSLNYVGLNGNYTFDQWNNVPATDQGLPMFYFQIQNGKLVLLDVGTKAYGTAILPPWIKK